MLSMICLDNSNLFPLISISNRPSSIFKDDLSSERDNGHYSWLASFTPFIPNMLLN
jgi:hypothetical protein